MGFMDLFNGGKSGKGAVKPSSGKLKGAAGGVKADAKRPGGHGAAASKSDEIEFRLCDRELEKESDMAELVSFYQPLSEEIAGYLQAHICPLEVSKGSGTIIFLVTPAHRNSIDLREVAKHLKVKKYQLRGGVMPNVYVCRSQTLLISVAKGELGGRELAMTKRMRGAGEEGSLWRAFEDVMTWANAEGASDIHLNIYDRELRSQVRFHIDGKYVAPERFAMPTTILSQMAGVAYQKSKGGMEPNFQPQKEQQCNIFMTLPNTDQRVMLRWASMATDDGPQITMRMLKLDALLHAGSLEDLGYLTSQIDQLKRAQKSEGGAIVLCGVVGSGKSTTIATVMNGISPTRKVMTIEDPREYIIKGAHANTVSRPLDGSGSDSFVAKMRTLKRSAFQDLLLGEIRDEETGLVFSDVVLSGQNLYTTTHARRAFGIFDKLASPMVKVEREVLASPGAVKLGVYQALLPVCCTRCRLSAKDWLADHPDEQPYYERIRRLYGVTPEMINVRNPDGCDNCRREGMPELAGFKGRTVVAEMIEPDDQMLSYVKDGDSLGLAKYVDSQRKHDYMDACMDGKSALECAVYKMSQGLIDPHEIEPRFQSFDTIEMNRERNKR